MIRILSIVIVTLTMLVEIRIATAQEIARVRNDLVTKSDPWVGQRVPFHIELMSASFFSGTAHFDLPEISGVILMKVKGSPTVTSESIDDDTWSVQRHSFMAFAHRSGTIEIPSFEVRFTVSEGFGKPKKPQRLKTSPMKFESKLPPGAEGYALLVSTTELKATESWSVQPGEENKVNLFVGDAISRKITLEANDIPAMALPKIPFSKIDGLTRYPNAPELDDKEYRGELIGKRTESVTYVCEKAGVYEIPPMVITWWDIEKKQLEKESFPAVILSVQADPNQVVEPLEVASSGKDSKPGKGSTVAVAAFFLLMFVVVYMGWRFVENRVIKLAGGRREKANEPRLFSNVMASCAENDPVKTYEALTKWIECSTEGSNTPTLDGYANESPNARELIEQLDLLQQAVIGKTAAWSGETLAKVLAFARKMNRSEKQKTRAQILPSLNPGKS